MIAGEFFEIDESWEFAPYFDANENPVLWLGKIGRALGSIPKKSMNDIPNGCCIGDGVYIHESVRLPHVCAIEGPAYIGAGTVIRPFAYVRENVIVGKNCVIGNSSELKNSILLNGVQIPHFNYVGDSILGNFVHLGAGVILANLRLDKGEITLRYGEIRIGTGMRKVGAIIGDRSEIACNVVLNPGSVLPKFSMIFNGGNVTK